MNDSAASAKVEGNFLVLRIPVNPAPYRPSATGKTLSVATTHGFKVLGDINGEPLSVSVNAFVKNQPK